MVYSRNLYSTHCIPLSAYLTFIVVGNLRANSTSNQRPSDPTLNSGRQVHVPFPQAFSPSSPTRQVCDRHPRPRPPASPAPAPGSPPLYSSAPAFYPPPPSSAQPQTPSQPSTSPHPHHPPSPSPIAHTHPTTNDASRRLVPDAPLSRRS